MEQQPTPITTNMELLSGAGDPQINYDPSKGIRTPAPTDVICGRGKMTVAHPGNRRFRQLVMAQKNAYQKAKRRDDKSRITFDLVHQLRTGNEGGR
jgi:hypothetical protein